MFFLYIFALLVATTTVVPYPLEIVDLTQVFDENTINYPHIPKYKMTAFGRATTDYSYGFLNEEYTSSTHSGTHIDSPCTLSKYGWCVNDIPLNYLVAPAAIIDITEKAKVNRDALLQINDLENWERLTRQSLNGKIVMIRSGWSSKWSDPEGYSGTADNDVNKLHFPGMSPEAAQWLVDNRNVYGVGSEALAVDTGTSTNFTTHRILSSRNVYAMTTVGNMDKLPIYGVTLYVLPMRLGNASAAPTRIFAIYPKNK